MLLGGGQLPRCPCLFVCVLGSGHWLMPKLGREGWGAIKQVSSVSGSDGFWTGVLPFFAWSCYLLIIYEIPPPFS